MWLFLLAACQVPSALPFGSVSVKESGYVESLPDSGPTDTDATTGTGTTGTGTGTGTPSDSADSQVADSPADSSAADTACDTSALYDSDCTWMEDSGRQGLTAAERAGELGGSACGNSGSSMVAILLVGAGFLVSRGPRSPAV